MLNLEAKLEFWINNNLNVLFRGKHGAGKTSIIIQAFDKAGIKWKYFSASTMDPWTDFIGIPKEIKDPISGVAYLDFVKPREFADDQIEAIIFDEFNRSPKKVRNAVMELIQFKSINGRKFNNLKMIWAAINPEDDDNNYDVETLDPAQLDRFQVHVDIPYIPDMNYFLKNYNDRGESAVLWWKNLNTASQNKVSPRRLEYAVRMFDMGGDVRDVLPKDINSSELVAQLKTGNFRVKLEKLFKSQDITAASVALEDENFYNGSIDLILKNDDYIKFFTDALPDEKLAGLIQDSKVTDKVLRLVSKSVNLKNTLDDILNASNNLMTSTRQKFTNWINTNYPDHIIKLKQELHDTLDKFLNSNTKHQRKTRERVAMLDDIIDKTDLWKDNNHPVREKVALVMIHFGIITNKSSTAYLNAEKQFNDIIKILRPEYVNDILNKNYIEITTIFNDNDRISTFKNTLTDMITITSNQNEQTKQSILNNTIRDAKLKWDHPVTKTKYVVNPESFEIFEKWLDE